ncbi:multifunctional CCA tRNA nucleotidyl transferase/2'3'-cyclic phosphodiesterase/2'nucleotidase/phosphatase [Marinobacter fonticola]|uniref:multifunctional CCA tRNA nucleotidyl transferase/2'3'-cyclic phosphodiesterase/2'nucleotidase/phosphatase n=1 Tax=Marinobacter fonticola TaxID=2603215 RepID=UPI0011E673E4|nr:multifunctional CCA tRNA nucleotidyl transferase/2'3'-cyclic phosphodiesterase/2'nucleotidase/phosphatase [Marinobacter fonticola]
MQIYLVGGAVRDALLGRAIKDRDWVVVGATPEAMKAKGFRQVGADFPVFLHPQTHEEYALARTERKHGHGYHGFEVHSTPGVTLEDDLRRRDLTINAMAQAEDGRLVDPFGGQQDLEQRLLRHVSPAFAEDPLRILRVARFAARLGPLGFSVAPETQALMQHMVTSGEVGYLVPERIWQETQRALLETEPTTYFRVLHACGALSKLIPPLATLLDVNDNPPPLKALTNASQHSNSSAVRYAALLGGLDSAFGVDALSQSLRAPNDCQALASLVATTADDLLGEAKEDAGLLMAVLDRSDAWRRPERFEDLLTATDALGEATGRQLASGQIRQALVAARAVDPQALMAQGHKGKALGDAIRRTRRARIGSVLEQSAAGENHD